MGGEGVTQGVRLADRHISAARFTRGESAAAVSLGGVDPRERPIHQQRDGPETSKLPIGFPQQAPSYRVPDASPHMGPANP
jgi:hypothetical protein